MHVFLLDAKLGGGLRWCVSGRIYLCCGSAGVGKNRNSGVVNVATFGATELLSGVPYNFGHG